MGELFFAKRSGQKLSKSEWQNSEFFREGLEVGADGITDEAAAVLAERHDYRLRRDTIMSRAREGVGATAIMLGGGFIGSMFDPLAVGGAFVPGYMMARAASQAVNTGRIAKAARQVETFRAAQQVKLGVTTSRLAEGAAIGATEAALFEPIIYGAAKHEQDDTYGAMDSFLNIAFGGLLGGGLHAVVGKVGDMAKRASPRTVHKAMEVAVAETVTTGKVTGAAKVFDFDPTIKAKRAGVEPKRFNLDQHPHMLGKPPEGRFDETFEPMRKGVKYPDVVKARNDRPKSLIQKIKEYGGIKADDPNIGDVKRFADKDIRWMKKKDGLPLDEIGLRLSEDGFFVGRIPEGDRPTINEILEAIEEDYGSWEKGVGGRYFSESDPKREAFLEAEREFDYAQKMGIDLKGLSDEDYFRVRAQKDDLESRMAVESSKPEGASQEEIDLAMAQADKAGAFGREFSDEFGQRFNELDAEPYYTMPEDEPYMAEMDALMADINARIDAGELDGAEVSAYIAEADEMIRRAEQHDIIAMEAVTCMLRKV
ncbi:MAG: hypothetical protein VW496_01630 [Pelagibacteraceae bacterium]